MYGLYDKDGILRFVNSDKGACLAYAELFELSTNSYSLMPLNDNLYEYDQTNLDLNQAKNNN